MLQPSAFVAGLSEVMIVDPGTSARVSDHTHVAAEITDFDDEVLAVGGSGGGGGGMSQAQVLTRMLGS